MKKVKFFLGLVIILAAVACGKQEQRVEETTNNNIKVDLLFEKDGCKVYRFYDYGRAIYFTDCRGKVEYTYRQQNGKTSHDEYVQNETVK
jgi:hypothetical protein